MSTILVTGGLGFIGSHTCISLLEQHYKIVVVDNCCNSYQTTKDSIETISGQKIEFYRYDLLDNKSLELLFKKYNFELVIHFAGLKSVSESIKDPLTYYNTNITSTLILLDVMEQNNCNKLIFSSSATVYGDQKSPVDENSKTGNCITNPYGRTKYFIEQILQDQCKANKNLSVVCLRYFNPVGAHKSGLIGENPLDTPNNLFPHILAMASGKTLNIFGDDYKTEDGTCIRDFIHVVDLAWGHVCVLKKLDTPGFFTYNLGTGQGTSVMQLVTTFCKVNNIKPNFSIQKRREGDVECVYADCNKAYNEIGWKSKFTIEDICVDGYNYYTKNKL